MPSSKTRQGLIHSCVEDLRVNGIELAGADVQRIQKVVHDHLDYFQMMLGGEPPEREVVSLIARDTQPGGDRAGIADRPMLH